MKFSKMILVALIASLAVSSLPARAQYDPAFPKEEFAERRARLLEHIEGGVAVFLGARTVPDYNAFRQNNTFYYFSGVEAPDSILVIDGRSKRSYLFIHRFTEREETVNGPQLHPGKEAQKLTGIDSVQEIEAFVPFLLASLSFPTVAGSRDPVVYLSLTPEELPGPDTSFRQFLASQQPWDGRLTREGRLSRWLRERLPQVTFKSYDEFVFALRRIKSPREIEVMRRAGELTALGINEAIRATRPGLYEYQLAAAASFAYHNGGAPRLAFWHIAASGPNINTIHYSANNRQLEDGDVILMDTGAEYRYYAADITRMWSASGRFTKEEEGIYETVREASEAVIAAIKPGVTRRDLIKIMRAVYEKRGFGQYAIDYIGHYTGMAVHDVGDRDQPFEPGVVFNVEPLLSMDDKQLHFRLEDTILVTEDGHENFTAKSPVALKEIYRIYDEPSRLIPEK